MHSSKEGCSRHNQNVIIETLGPKQEVTELGFPMSGAHWEFRCQGCLIEECSKHSLGCLRENPRVVVLV